MALTERGWPSVRDGQQGAGGLSHHDLNHSLPGHHVEVKRVEAFSCVTRAMDQAKKDAGELVPIVMSRTNRDEWLVTLRLDDFLPHLEFLK